MDAGTFYTFAEQMRDALAEKRKLIEAAIEKEIDALDDFEEQITKLESVQMDAVGRLASFLKEFERVVADLEKVPTVMESYIRNIENLLTELSASLNTGAGRLAQFGDAMLNSQREVVTEVTDTLAQSEEELRDGVTGKVEELNDLVAGVVEELQEKAQNIEEKVTELHENADERVAELFLEMLPGGISEKTEDLVEGLRHLQTAIGQLDDLTEPVDDVRERARLLLDLVEEAKPVLKLAAQIL